MRLMLSSLTVFGVSAAVFPGLVLPEGAVRLLDCTVAKVCDAGGNCEAASDQVTFRMEPVDLGAGGSARYALSYGDTRVDMRAMSDAGPFFWTTGPERDVLLASSDTQWLWHRLTLDASPEATVRFLVCSFQQ